MLYKYCSWDDNYSIQNLRTCSLRFNMPNRFNDPFDIYACFKMNEEERLNAINLFSKDKGIDLKIAMNMSVDEIVMNQRMIDRRDIFNSRYGVTCFSRENNNILMWSHYAKAHTGYCLGFDVDENNSLENFLDQKENNKTIGKYWSKLIPVQYVQNDERPEFHISEDNKIDDVLSQKFQAWSYEKEVRIMIRTEELMKFPTCLKYQPNKLRKVVVGAAMNLEIFSKMYHSIKEMKKYGKMDIHLFCAILNPERYELDVHEVLEDDLSKIMNNYRMLQNVNEWLFLHKAIKELSVNYGEKKVSKAWKYAINNITLSECFDLISSFHEIDLSYFLKQGGSAKADNRDMAIKVSLFMNYMIDTITYQLKN